MLEFIGNCTIKLYTLIADIPRYIMAGLRHKRQIKENKRLKLQQDKLDRIRRNNEIAKIQADAAAKRSDRQMRLAVGRSERDYQQKLDRYRGLQQMSPGLQQEVERYRHCNITKNTEITYQDENYRIHELLELLDRYEKFGEE